MGIKFRRRGSKSTEKKKKHSAVSFLPAYTTRGKGRTFVLDNGPTPVYRQFSSSDEESVRVAKDWHAEAAYAPLVRNDSKNADPLLRNRTLDSVGLAKQRIESNHYQVNDSPSLVDSRDDSYDAHRVRDAPCRHSAGAPNVKPLATYYYYEDPAERIPFPAWHQDYSVQPNGAARQDDDWGGRDNEHRKARQVAASYPVHDAHQPVDTVEPEKSTGVFKAVQGLFRRRSQPKQELTNLAQEGKTNEHGSSSDDDSPSSIKAILFKRGHLAAASTISDSSGSASSIFTSDDDDDLLEDDDDDIEEWDEAILNCLFCRRP